MSGRVRGEHTRRSQGREEARGSRDDGRWERERKRDEGEEGAGTGKGKEEERLEKGRSDGV